MNLIIEIRCDHVLFLGIASCCGGCPSPPYICERKGYMRVLVGYVRWVRVVYNHISYIKRGQILYLSKWKLLDICALPSCIPLGVIGLAHHLSGWPYLATKWIPGVTSSITSTWDSAGIMQHQSHWLEGLPTRFLLANHCDGRGAHSAHLWELPILFLADTLVGPGHSNHPNHMALHYLGSRHSQHPQSGICWKVHQADWG